jgi:RNA polymerase sigma-70 factor (ECF subfamily)
MYELLTDIDDKELVFAFENGDSSAFEAIYRKYWSRLYHEGLKMLKDQELAKDAVQDVFTSLWSRFGQTGQIQSLSGFLYISIRNRTLYYLSRDKTKETFIKHAQNYPINEFAHIDEDVFQQGAKLEKNLQERIEAAIESLPPKTRAAFDLYISEQLSHKEIAQRTGTSQGTIKKQISYALQFIRGKILFF